MRSVGVGLDAMGHASTPVAAVTAGGIGSSPALADDGDVGQHFDA